MYNRIILYPYKMASKSAKALQDNLKRKASDPILRVYPDGRYRPRLTDLIINWGNSKWPEWENDDVVDSILNAPNYLDPTEDLGVRVATNKLTAFQMLARAGVPVPRFTVNPDEAWEWIQLGRKVIARHLLRGYSGRGIEFIDGPMVAAPLYVQYLRKIAEYRVHVFCGEVIDVQRKRRSTMAAREGILDTRIRSRANGWVFTRENCSPDTSILALGVNAVHSLGLDFGAVDIIVTTRNKAYVLEVNTAPGLEGRTVESYSDAILQQYRRG